MADCRFVVSGHRLAVNKPIFELKLIGLGKCCVVNNSRIAGEYNKVNDGEKHGLNSSKFVIVSSFYTKTSFLFVRTVGENTH